MTQIKPFTHKQQHLIERGNLLTDQLKSKVAQALGVTKLKVATKRHVYIFSTPGAGKTFTVMKTAADNNVQTVNIHGASSMNSLITRLAYERWKQPNEEIVVWIDDCDSVFMDEECLNVMKGALDEERNTLTWGKNMTAQINKYAASSDPKMQEIAEALQSFQQPGVVGVEIPTDNMRFIITSNKELIPPAHLNKGKRITKKMMHEAAIRDRVIYEEFKLGDDDSWGWVASVVMSTDLLGLDDTQKHYLLDWMHTNWARLPATSMRAVKELAADMINYPTDYPDRWDLWLSK